jgi:protein associated with RNAse G/E
MRLRPGQTVMLQEVWRDRLWAARPLTVVDDSAERLVLWCPLGTVRKIPAPPPERSRPATRAEHVTIALKNCDWVFADHRWDVSTLWLIEPEAWHATWVSFHPDGRHLGWYVNFQEPFRRTSRGIEAMDLMLDIVADADRNWRWKDQDEFDLVVAEGLYTDATIAAVRREADSVVRQIEAGEEPFDETWLSWKPPAEWEIPVLPAGWDRID